MGITRHKDVGQSERWSRLWTKSYGFAKCSNPGHPTAWTAFPAAEGQRFFLERQSFHQLAQQDCDSVENFEWNLMTAGKWNEFDVRPGGHQQVL